MSENIPPPQPAASANLNLENKQQVQVQQQQQLFKLPVGAQFNAAVIGGDKNGNPIIKFAGNDLVLSSPLALAKGAQIALKVDGASGTINLQLLSVDGKLPPTQAQANSNNLQNQPPPQPPILKLLNIVPSNSTAAQTQLVNTAPTQNAAPTQAVVVSSSGSTNAAGVVINPVAEALQGVRAQVKAQLPAELAGKILQSIPNSLPQGSEVNFKVTNIQQPSQPTSALAAQASAANPQSQQVGTDNKVLKGQEFHQQNLGQNQQSTQAKQNFSPNIQTANDGTIKVNAQVISSNNAGQILVDTGLGKISLNTPLTGDKIQPGAILSLEIANFGQAKQAAPTQQTPLQLLVNDWPALRELAGALENAGQKNALNKLAGLDSIFASRIAGFFNSVKSQNINNWLSPELMDALDDATKEQIIAKLRGDFSNLGRLANDTQSSWQTFLFPVFDGEELRQAKFHLKYLEDEEGEQNKEEGARFVVEFDAGAFGEMQLDGLVRKKLAANKFDLIVRSHSEVEPEVQADIRQIFNNAQELTGFSGGLEFSTMQDFPNEIMDEKLGRLMHSSDVVEA